MPLSNPVAEEFVKSHRYAIMATGRKDGSPHQAPIVYNYDGSDVIINSGSTTAKIRHLLKRPRMSLSVIDGMDIVVLNGTVELIDQPEEIIRLRERLPLPPAALLGQHPEWGPQIAVRMTPTSIGTLRLGPRVQS